MPGALGGKLMEEGGYMYSIDVTQAEVETYYKTQLPPLGWLLFFSGGGDNDNILLIFIKGSQLLTVSAIVLPGDDLTTVMLILT